MADVFSFAPKQDYGIGFKEPETAILVGEGTGMKMTLVQQWNIQYQQQVTPVFECGTSTVYFSAKHANGTMSINRIVAENPETFIKDLGQVCDPKNFTMTAYTGACGGSAGATAVQPVKLSISGMIASSIGFSGQAQQAYVAEDIQTMFAALKVTQ